MTIFNSRHALSVFSGIALLCLFLSLLVPSATAQSGQWQYSDDGTSKWQFLNTSRIGLSDVHLADFNGDGRTDVFRGNGSSWYISYSGRGSWTRVNGSAYRVGNLRFGDFNGDGRTDVFRANGSRWYVSYSGTGPWQQINRSSITIGNLAVGDFNGDGRADVFYGNGSIWRISYGGNTGWVQVNRSSYRASQLAFADFNGDGRTDVFRATGSRWYVSYSGTGSWRQVNRSSMRVSDLRFGDMTGDGRADVFRGNGSAWYISRSATGGWQQINRSNLRTSQVKLGDFDRDGKADVFYPGWAKKFNLKVSRHNTVAFSNSQADSMIASGEGVIKWRNHATLDTACRVEISRSSSVSSFSRGNGVILTKYQLNRVFDVNRNIKIVQTIDYCDGFNASTIGCGKFDKLNQIIEVGVATGEERGRVFAHELGHNVDLDHTTLTNNVMRGSLGASTNRLTAGQCSNYKNY